VGVTLLIICVVFPVVSTVAFVVWLARRERMPRWLLAVALVPPLMLLPLIAWWAFASDRLLLGLLLAVLPVVSVVAQIAALSGRRAPDRRWRAVGLAAPLPVMALLVAAYAYTLVVTPQVLHLHI